ncbi:hypothetical protein B0H15DRAFT_777192 [Mycena belliarum]|uniref:Uncharacterized protein n=1 Tax=Mycena belliarum TaxID=1033014 RepID=A0AAD6U6P3_9AGAR|nr:hypothetical protein B0H15DRAFT_777192 [Mycena belliae]
MHLHGLNIPDLFISLWRGLIQCDPDDDKSTWDWVVLIGEVWKNHGEEVERATQYLPGCFDKPPRNPAQKMSSGYKAQEFITYLYVLGPALLRRILPEKYWKHYCKLVRGIRLMWQRKIPVEQLLEAHRMLCDTAEEFEILYYQRKSSRLHFCRQSVHGLLHTVPETIRVGPGGYRSQWTMERTIGNLGEEIKQHSTPYANLSQRAIRRCQTNALKVMIPDLEPEKGLPAGSEDLGNGFVLLRARDEYRQVIEGAYGDAIIKYLETEGDLAATEGWKPRVARWARLRLPNGQIIRSVWKESRLAKVRIARNIKCRSLGGSILFAEVQFFFQATIDDTEQTLALVSVYSAPDADLLRESYNTVMQCEYFGEDNLEVIKITQIQAGVGMVPIGDEGTYFVAEKLGLDIATMGGMEEDMDV